MCIRDSYRVEARGGNVVRADDVSGMTLDGFGGLAGNVITGAEVNALPLNGRRFQELLMLRPGLRGIVHGRVVDPSGAAIPGATVTVTSVNTGKTYTAISDAEGEYLLEDVSPGRIRIDTDLTGFKHETASADLDGAVRADVRLEVGTLTETVEVFGRAPLIQTESAQVSAMLAMTNSDYARQREKAEEEARTAPSANVANLQRRVAGVLPVDIEVPRAGTSHRFVRTLALDGETTVQLKYRAR